MKANKLLWIALIIVLASADVMSFGMPEAEVTVQVIDENGQPIENATVRMAFEQGTDPIRQRPKSKKIEGKTGKDGIFRAKKVTTGYVGVTIEKPGYYQSHTIFRFWHSDPNQKKQEEWKSKKQTILKKIENPVPMYARRIRQLLPLSEGPIGFDMEAGDFVAPFGSGKINDLVFQFSGVYHEVRIRDEKLLISFRNSGDGIQEFVIQPEDHSTFKSPKQAPEAG